MWPCKPIESVDHVLIAIGLKHQFKMHILTVQSSFCRFISSGLWWYVSGWWNILDKMSPLTRPKFSALLLAVRLALNICNLLFLWASRLGSLLIVLDFLEKSLCSSHFSSACFVPNLSHHLWFDYPNNVWWTETTHEASYSALFYSLMLLFFVQIYPHCSFSLHGYS